MPGDNVPDRWGSHFVKCEICGTVYHESEGGCWVCADRLCAVCNKPRKKGSQYCEEHSAK